MPYAYGGVNIRMPCHLRLHLHMGEDHSEMCLAIWRCLPIWIWVAHMDMGRHIQMAGGITTMGGHLSMP